MQTTILIILVSFVLGLGGTVVAQDELSVPAPFIRELSVPGQLNHFQRPADISVDRQFGEVFIVDPGNGRVLIYDTDGVFRFEFSTAEYIGAPADLLVTPEGFIYILGAVRGGRAVAVFDFDGLYLDRFDLADGFENRFDIGGMAMDSQQRLYVLNKTEKTIVRYARPGVIDKRFEILTDVDEDARQEAVVGQISIHNDIIHVPVASLGQLYRYSLDGRKINHIGQWGTLIGQLNFPVASSVTPEGIVLILDKHRFNVQCYTQDGQFLGEFGGRGVSDGWFYHPTLLAADSKGQIYVGQIFNNRVQVIDIPEFIYDRRNALSPTQSKVSTPDNYERNALLAGGTDAVVSSDIQSIITIDKDGLHSALTHFNQHLTTISGGM